MNTHPPLTGAYKNDTYVWAIAMNLAWNELVGEQLGGRAEVQSTDASVRQLIDGFNSGIFNKALLDPAAYFVASGMGQAAVSVARERLLLEKDISSAMLDEIKLAPGELFSYARVEKMLSWMMEFVTCVGTFKGEKVVGFRPGSGSCRGVEIWDYHPEKPDKSVVCLRTDDGEDEVILMSGYTPGREAEMVAQLSGLNSSRASALNGRDTLIIPAVDFSVERDYPTLIGQQLVNPRLPDVYIAEMSEEIRFSMNHKGVEFIAEARMIGSRGMPPPARQIIFDQPFLIVLRQSGRELPYLVVGVNGTAPLRRIRTNKPFGAPFST